MNAEQKQRAQAALTKWWATDSNKAALSTGYEMAGVLQELVDAPEAEPVAWMVYGRGGGWLHVVRYEKDADEYRARGFKVSPFYTAPPAPSVPDGWREAFTKCKDAAIASGAFESYKAVGEAFDALEAKLAAPTPAEAPADVARDAERYRWLRNPTTDPALVIDKRVGPSFWDYEYRAGDALDAAIDAAIERDKLKGQS